MIIRMLQDFLRLEAASGILLLAATVLAMLAVNSPVEGLYTALLDIPVEIRFGTFQIAKPLLLWINDGLMAIFFFLIGLEVKREFLAGELREPARVVLPVIAAIGGMAAPALIYAGMNWGDAEAMRGWAIPSATDIAFSLGVLGLLGTRIPASLRLFLMTLAIVDDLGAILIIALFYTVELQTLSLVIVAVCIGFLYLMNRRGVLSLAPYLLVGFVMWAAVLKSGVHATLAGVITAFFIPFIKQKGESYTQLEAMEHDLHPVVAFGVLPLFAFANTGISFSGLTLDAILHPIPLGIALALVFGKIIGIFGLSWLGVILGFAKLPSGANWMQMLGVSGLCGIGFTMSLFISSLAFENTAIAAILDPRVGVLLGSIVAGLLGYLILSRSPQRASETDT